MRYHNPDNLIYTRNGLKIRFSAEAMEPVIRPLKLAGRYEDILLDMELWVNLPNAISTVSAITAALATGSWIHVLVFALLGFLVGVIIQEVSYSDVLKGIFPMFLGGWLIAIPATIACSIYLGVHGKYLTTALLVLVVLANWLHYTDFLLLFLMPFRLWVMKSLESRLGIRRPSTLTERLYVFLCSKQARQLGIELDWELYDQQMAARSRHNDTEH